MVTTSVSMIPRNHVDSEFVQYSCGCFISSLSLYLSEGKKSFPVTSITLELESCPTRFPSCRRNSLLKSNPFKILFLPEIGLQLIRNNIQRQDRYEIPRFSSPSPNAISLNFSLNCFSLPLFCPTCHWRFSLTRQRDSRQPESRDIELNEDFHFNFEKMLSINCATACFRTSFVEKRNGG